MDRRRTGPVPGIQKIDEGVPIELGVECQAEETRLARAVKRAAERLSA